MPASSEAPAMNPGFASIEIHEDEILDDKKFRIRVVKNKRDNDIYNFLFENSEKLVYKGGRMKLFPDDRFCILKQNVRLPFLSVKSVYRPYSQLFIQNEIIRKIGPVSLLLKINTHNLISQYIHELKLGGKYKSDSLKAKSMLSFSREHYDFILQNRFTFKIDAAEPPKHAGGEQKPEAGVENKDYLDSFRNWLSRINIRLGFEADANVSTMELLKHNLFTYFFTKRNAFLFSYGYGLDRNLNAKVGRLLFTYSRTSDSYWKLFFKVAQTIETKESEISTIIEWSLNDVVLLKNLINSEYNVGGSIIYIINDSLKIFHSAKVDLKRLFTQGDGYRIGFGIEVNV